VLLVGEMLGEAFRVDGRRGDDQAEVRPAPEQALHHAQQEVDVEAALVGLVDDQRVVAQQVTIVLQLGEQETVGHHRHARIGAGLVGEAHLVADGGTAFATLLAFIKLLGQPAGDVACGDPARLGVTDQPAPTVTELEQHLGDLGGLPRAGLAGDDGHRVALHGLEYFLARPGDRQALGVGDVDRQCLARGDLVGGLRHLVEQSVQGLLVGRALLELAQLPVDLWQMTQGQVIAIGVDIRENARRIGAVDGMAHPTHCTKSRGPHRQQQGREVSAWVRVPLCVSVLDVHGGGLRAAHGFGPFSFKVVGGPRFRAVLLAGRSMAQSGARTQAEVSSCRRTSAFSPPWPWASSAVCTAWACAGASSGR